MTVVGLGNVGGLVATLDMLVDESVGIIRRIGCVDETSGRPDFVHVEAHLCDTRALVGQRCVPMVEASAADRPTALNHAAADAIACYCAALYDRNSLPLSSHADAGFERVRPSDFACFSEDQYGRAGFPYVPAADDAPLRWASAIDLVSGETVSVPAAFVFHPFAYERRGGDLPIALSTTTGLACAESRVEAAIAGLADVVCRDAAALFWQAMIVPPLVTNETLTPALRNLVGWLERGGDRVLVLDVTTDNTVPAFVVVLASDHRDRPAFVFDAGADLSAELAVTKALYRLAGAKRRCLAAMKDVTPPTPDNDWEDMIDPVDHLLHAADYRNRASVEPLIASDVHRDFGEYEDLRTASPEGDLEKLARLVTTTGHRALVANLTSEDIALFGIHVCRAIVPGYLPLHARHGLRLLGGPRLFEAPQRLGYRGISPGGTGNPAPHPFYR